MKKSILLLSLTVGIYLVFSVFHLMGTQAVMELSSIVVGLVYLSTSYVFFKERTKNKINILLSAVLVLAAAFAILPLLFFFINSFYFVININYNDILFNHYKSYLNSVIGLLLFMLVCIVHFMIEFKAAIKAEEKRKYKILISILVIFTLVLVINILRQLGVHVSFSRVLFKISFLFSIFILLPYFIYVRLLKIQLFTISFLLLILIFLNGLPLNYVFSTNFSTTHWFEYTKPVREMTSTGLDTVKTINSFKKIDDNFYSITFYGDYSSILEKNNKQCLEESINPGHFCSLFAASGDPSHYLFGRNLDNSPGWKCKTLLCKTNPDNGYASMSFVRMADFGFDFSEDMNSLSATKKLDLLNAVFWLPDGMNEKGLVVAMADVGEQKLNLDTNKAFINCTYLVREILDHAKDISEAIEIIKKYNIMNDVWQGSFSQHLLIADASGNSVIAEISKGQFRFIPNKEKWLVTTNDPSYNVSVDEQKKVCPRYKSIAETLEAKKGTITTEKALEILKQVGHQYTQWSAVYDISKKEIKVVIDYDFAKIHHFKFDGK